MTPAHIDLDKIFRNFEYLAKDPTVTDEDLRDELSHFLEANSYQRTPYKLQFKTFFRARKGTFDSIEEACQEFYNVEKLSAPPNSAAKACRCNLDGHSVFYCSSENGVPVFEVRPEKGQYVAVASFWPKGDDPIEMIVPIIGVKQIRETFLKRGIRDGLVKILESDMHYKSTHSLALEIDSRLAEWFVIPVDTVNKHIYRLTTAYFNGLLKYAHAGAHTVNSLIYPSVESAVSGYNIVMEKDVARNNLQVGWTTIHKVENIIGNIIFMRPLKQLKHIETNGDIVWEDTMDSTRLWALEPNSRIHKGPLSEVLKNINKFDRHLSQLAPNAKLGF